MKIKVINRFADKYNTARIFEPETVLDFPEERANDLISRKLAVALEPEVKVEETKPKVEVKAEEAEKVEEVKEEKPKRTRGKSNIN